MTREELIAKANAKIERELLLEKARAKMTANTKGELFSEESPDALAYTDRLIAKNFANSPEAQRAYIVKQYPDHEVTLNDGRVYMRKDGNQPWQALDPNTGFFSTDFLKDVGDIGYDTASGAVNTVATALGGAAGGLATIPSGGVGAIPAAMAAGGATSAGSEYLRQKLGQSLGIPQDVDGTQVAIAGGVGAVSPLLFGAGNTVKAANILKPVAGVTSAAEQQVLNNAQRGVAKRGLDWIAPKLSSVPTDAIEAYSKHGQQGIDTITNSGGLINYLDDVANNSNKAIDDNRAQIGRNLGNAYKNAVQEVPLNDVRAPFENAINTLEQSKANNPTAWTEALEGRLQALKAGYKANIPAVNIVDAERAFDLQQGLKRLNGNFELKKDANNFDFLSAVNSSYANLNQGLDKATAGVSSKLKGEYKDALALQDLAGNSFNDGQKLYNTLSNMDKGAKLQFKEQVVPRVKALGVDLQNPYEQVQSYKYFADPKLLPLSNGSTSTTYTNTLGNLGADVGGMALDAVAPGAGRVGAAAGRFTGSLGASPQVTKWVIDANRKQVPFYLNQNASVPFLEYMLNENNR